jgi:hypothetical protein
MTLVAPSQVVDPITNVSSYAIAIVDSSSETKQRSGPLT